MNWSCKPVGRAGRLANWCKTVYVCVCYSSNTYECLIWILVTLSTLSRINCTSFILQYRDHSDPSNFTFCYFVSKLFSIIQIIMYMRCFTKSKECSLLLSKKIIQRVSVFFSISNIICKNNLCVRKKLKYWTQQWKFSDYIYFIFQKKKIDIFIKYFVFFVNWILFVFFNFI